MDRVQRGGPWTVSTGMVHGPGVHVLYTSEVRLLSQVLGPCYKAIRHQERRRQRKVGGICSVSASTGMSRLCTRNSVRHSQSSISLNGKRSIRPLSSKVDQSAFSNPNPNCVLWLCVVYGYIKNNSLHMFYENL